jgi:hypothetical protein
MRVTSSANPWPLSCIAAAVSLVVPIKPLALNLKQGPGPDQGATRTFEIPRKEFA